MNTTLFREPVAATVDLTAEDARLIDELIDELTARYVSAEDEEFIREAPRLSWRLPKRLVDAVLGLRREEPSAALVLRGVEVDGTTIGPTPLGWRDPSREGSTLRYELYQMLVGALLGDVFGWSTLQDGRLIHDVVPIPDERGEQSGHGTVQLEWHTEDGFHPYRCDYLLLFGMRNIEAVPTTLSAVEEVALSRQHRQILREPRFLIHPDNEHLRQAARIAGDQGPHRMQIMNEHPKPCAVLFGSPQYPYLRVDPAFMSPAPGDEMAAAALEALVTELEGRLQDVALGPGDLLIVDNYKAVHGRSAFDARYDGTDRWLKKVVITRDLRKSRELRAEPTSRVLQ